MTPRARRRLRPALATAALLLAAAAPAPASAATTWLCRPGLAGQPCAGSLDTTRYSPSGTRLGVDRVRRRDRGVDCFYVYPTVSGQDAPAASLRIDPEVRSIARFQAARFAEHCRVFAPVYRQITLRGLLEPHTVTGAMRAQGYADVRDAWREYLRRHNRGRGVVLIGHSQGTFRLRELIAREIDRRPSVRRRLVSALLLGGNVLVRRGSDRGGDFRTIRACRSQTQLGCVVAFSLYGAEAPADARFGRTTEPGRAVLCTNPASLRGGTGRLDPVVPSAPFAPGTAIGGLTTAVGLVPPRVRTPWVAYPGAYTARCSPDGGADVLRVAPRAGAPDLRALPDATWGLHLVDANLPLGTLVELVGRQVAAYAGRRAGAPGSSDRRRARNSRSVDWVASARARS